MMCQATDILHRQLSRNVASPSYLERGGGASQATLRNWRNQSFTSSVLKPSAMTQKTPKTTPEHATMYTLSELLPSGAVPWARGGRADFPMRSTGAVPGGHRAPCAEESFARKVKQTRRPHLNELRELVGGQEYTGALRMVHDVFNGVLAKRVVQGNAHVAHAVTGL
eukprot:1160414-Pelagomonas_calceolata.AAC.6